MDTQPVIAVLGGARETARAVEWVSRSGARGFVVWGDSAKMVPTFFENAPIRAVAKADGILDVTHAFDQETRVAALIQMPRIPYARLSRAPWRPSSEDNWIEVDRLCEAVAALPRQSRVFAATGRGSIGALADHDGMVFLRQLKRHNLQIPFEHGQFVFGTAPFSVADEVALFKKLEIDVVLARNIGGHGSFPKLEAARRLGLPAILVRQPKLPEGPVLRTYEDVKAWTRTL